MQGLSAEEALRLPLEAPDSLALRWAAKNRWFGTDIDMTYYAFEAHDILMEQGNIPSGPEYYAEISAQVEAYFPDRFIPSDNNNILRQDSALAPAAVSRQGSTSGTRLQSQASDASPSKLSSHPRMYRHFSGLHSSLYNQVSLSASQLSKSTASQAILQQVPE